MRLWIMSDIHVELTRGWDLPAGDERPDFDVMIVAGDLIPHMERGVAWLRERVQDRPVIYIPGNHEFYEVDIDRTIEKAKEAAAGTNVHVMENETIRIADVTFAGCTLWTDFAINGDAHRAMAVAAERMNDFRKIRTAGYVERFRPSHALARHRRSRAFLDRVFDRELGRFRDSEPGDQIEGNFYLEPEEENVRPLPDAQRQAVAAATEAALDALTSEETGPRTHRDEAAAMVVQVILTGDAVRAIFDARRPAPRNRKGR